MNNKLLSAAMLVCAFWIVACRQESAKPVVLEHTAPVEKTSMGDYDKAKAACVRYFAAEKNDDLKGMLNCLHPKIVDAYQSHPLELWVLKTADEGIKAELNEAIFRTNMRHYAGKSAETIIVVDFVSNVKTVNIPTYQVLLAKQGNEWRIIYTKDSCMMRYFLKVWFDPG